MASPKSTLPNDEKEAQDSQYNPGEHHARKLNAAHDSIPGYDRANDGLDDHPISAGAASGVEPSDPTSEIRDAESNPSWISSYGGNKTEKGRRLTGANIKAILKKRGPLGLIGVIILSGGVGMFTLFSPVLLLVHIQQNLVDKFNTQNISATRRLDKIVVNKLTGTATSTTCSVTEIGCRFSRPSNSMLKQFEKNGIVALDKSGIPIEMNNDPFPNTRPDKFEFTTKNGVKLDPIEAKDFGKIIASNPEFRGAYHRSISLTYRLLDDSVFNGVAKLFSFSKKNNLNDSKNPEDLTSRINENVKGDSAGTKAAAAGSDEIAGLLEKEAADSVKKLAKSGKGNAIGLIAGGLCLASDIPGLIAKTARAYQMAQVIKYGMIFLTAASMLKSGDISPEQAALLGGLLTATVAGKSAMDSYGMKYALYGDNSPGSDSSYKKFAPGGGVISTLSSITQFTNSAPKDATCAVATNPATGTAIDVATSGTLVIPAINLAGGAILSDITGKVLPKVIEFIMKEPSVRANIANIAKGLMGDLTKDLVGKDVGNALVSGASNMFGQVASAGGNVPLSIVDAIAYNKVTDEVNLAYAQEDRATLSPLDPTNSNTVIGSFVNQFVPYFSNLTTGSGILSTFGTVTSKSLGSIFNTTAKAATVQDYSQCDDPSLNDLYNQSNKVAAGPFCNILYGIPPKYLDMDPQQIVDDLVQKGEVDKLTGEPKVDTSVAGDIASTFNSDSNSQGSLKDWMDLCGDGTTKQAVNCQIKDDRTAEYALYTIDRRLQRSIDNEDVYAGDNQTAPATTAASTARPANTKDANKGWTLNNDVDYSGTACDARTKDVGTYKNPDRGFTVRLCQVISFPSSSGASITNVSNVVNSLVSTNVVNMFEAAKADSINLGISDGMRAKGHPAYTVGSQHSTGLAVDLGTPRGGLTICFIGSGGTGTQDASNVNACRARQDNIGNAFRWLEAHAAQYGYFMLRTEPWHWSTSGF